MVAIDAVRKLTASYGISKVRCADSIKIPDRHSGEGQNPARTKKRAADKTAMLFRFRGSFYQPDSGLRRLKTLFQFIIAFPYELK